MISKNAFRAVLITTVWLSLFSLSSCNKKECQDPCKIDCENYDPCCGQTAADASFTIYEVVGGPIPKEYSVTPMATDTILRHNSALFKADFEAEYYEWSIGTDPRTWNTREFSLSFRSVPDYAPIEVRLKVYKPTDKDCFPNSQDTVTAKRYLVVVPRADAKFVGRYEGYLSSTPSKPNFLEIEDSVDQYGNRLYGYRGIIPTCNMPNRGGGNIYSGYRSFYINSRGTKLGCCYGLSGYGKLLIDGSFTMQMASYPFNPTDTCFWSGINDPYVADVFNGEKVD